MEQKKGKTPSPFSAGYDAGSWNPQYYPSWYESRIRPYPLLHYPHPQRRNPSTPSPFSAGYDAGSCKKTGDALQAEKEELNEIKSLIKNQGSQTSISEKQMTADDKFSEEGVQDKLQSKSVPRLPRDSSSPSPSSFRNPQYYPSWYESRIRPYPLLPPPPPRLNGPAQSVRNIARLQSQQSLAPSGLSYNQLPNSSSPVCSSKTKGEVGEKRDQVLPTTTVQCDPGIGQYHPSLTCEPSHEMSGGGYFWPGPSSAQRRADFQRRSLETVSEHGSPRFPNLPSFFNPSTCSPFSAGYDAGSCKKTGDALQAEKEELNEIKSLIKNQLSQTSISEKQMTADDKFSEEGVQDKLQSKSVPRLPHDSSSPSPSSFRNPQYYPSWYESRIRPYPLLPPPPPRLNGPAQSVRNIARLQSQQSLAPSGLSYNQLPNSSSPVCSSKTKGEVGEKRDQVLPTTTVQCDPGIGQYHPSLTCEPSHEMSGGGYFWPGPSSEQRRADFQRRSLETVSEHGSPRFPNLPSFVNPSTRSPFSAGYDAGSCKKTGDALQAEKEELNEIKSLIKNQLSQTSISEKQMTADDKFSEEGVQDKLQSKSVPRLPRDSSSPSPSSFRNPQYYPSWYESRIRPYPLLPPPPPRLNGPAQSVRNIARLQSQQSLAPSGLSYNQLPNSSSPVCSSKTKGEVGEKRDQVLPTTTVQCDPGIGQYHPSLTCEPSHEMSGGGYFWPGPSSEQRRADFQRRSLETVSEHGSPRFPNLPSFVNPSTRSPFSAGYDAGSCKKTGDALQAEKEELNEIKSLIKNQLSQTSISEKQMTADDKFSEEGVQDKLQSKSVPRLPRDSSSPSPSSFRNPQYYPSWYESRIRPYPLLPPPPPRLTSSAQSVRNIARLQSQQSLAPSGLSYNQLPNSSSPVCSNKTKGEVGEKTDQVLPTTTVQCDPGIEQYYPRLLCEPLHEMSGGGYFWPGPSSAQRRADLQRCRKKHISSAQSVRNTARLQSQQSLEPLDLSYNQLLNSLSPVCSSKTEGEVGEKRDQVLLTPPFKRNHSRRKLHTIMPQSLAIIPSGAGPPCPESSAEVPQGSSTGEELKEKEFSNLDVFHDLSPSQSELTQPEPLSDSTTFSAASNCNNVSFPWKPSHEMSDLRYFVPGPSSAQRRADLQRRLLKRLRVSDHGSTGESLRKDACGFLVQSESEPGGDHSALEEMGPPVTAEHYSTENSLPVNSHLQQPSDSFRGGTGVTCLPSYSTSSLSPITSAMIMNFTQAESIPDMLLNHSSEFIPDITVDTDPTDSDRDTYKVLSRISRDNSPSSPVYTYTYPQLLSLLPPPPSQSSLSYKPRKGNSRGHSFSSKKKHKKDSFSIASTIDSPDYMLDQPPPGTLTETGMIKNQSSAADATPGVNQDNTREMEPHATAGPSTLQLSTNDDDDSDSDAFYDRKKEWDESSGSIYSVSHACANWETASCEYGDAHFLSTPSLVSDQILHLPNRKDTDDGGPRFDNSRSTFSIPTCSQSIAPTVAGPVTAVNYSFTNTLPTHSHLQIFSSDSGWSRRGYSCLTRSHSMPSLSQMTSAKNKTFTRAKSLPDMLLKTSFEEFTPDITVDENDETYRFQCSCPGLYQCSVTGLVFHMEGEGDVVYRIVPWNRRLLAQHHKQPAGPLFDIKCLQQSVCQLHLPHCEIRSTGGCEFLSVAHVNDEGIEFIAPHKITETHVIINITGFSGFGNVKDGDSPPDPVRALVLLFYRPPADPDLESLLNVLLLPRNVVLRDVLRTRKKLVGDESYIEKSSHCKLHPKQEYTLSTCPGDDSVLVEPTKAEFDCDNYDNYIPSFQVILEKIMKHIKLLLRDTNSSHSVWGGRVCLSSTGVKRSCGPSALNLPPNERLLDIRSSFIDGISGPVLKSLLDKLFEKTVMTDSERESADEMQNKRDKARFVIDTVRKKGEAASSEMIEFLCEVDPFLCEHLGLI